MTIGPTCPVCGYIHRPELSTHMVGRFTWAVPLYHADYDGAPLRATRAEADADVCAHNRAISADTD